VEKNEIKAHIDRLANQSRDLARQITRLRESCPEDSRSALDKALNDAIDDGSPEAEVVAKLGIAKKK
jgi:hypothetical protein